MSRQIAALGVGIAAVAAAAALASGVMAARQPLSHTPLSDAERSARLIISPAPVTSVTLRFLSEKEWRDTGVGSDVNGMSNFKTTPCVISLRAQDWEITANPSTGRSAFSYTREKGYEDMGSLLSHELYHCVREDWHPEWSHILASRISSMIVLMPPRDRADGD